ncbi:helix-turn-helix transcriptional regulator [Desulfurispora thermophila]|uniref:helix-turn-helix transcriptional regulator n=1 Tax=Desulfurispora thermophila TaxID=265470 RepID=UPI0003697957|nr:WYL domain-containing protein [Desulfurispora thermophila]
MPRGRNADSAVKERRESILTALRQVPANWLTYEELRQALAERGFTVSPRTLRYDCAALARQGLLCVQRGRVQVNLAAGSDDWGELADRVHSRQRKKLALLKILYNVPGGLTTAQLLAGHPALGGRETLESLLQELAIAGLVSKTEQCWQLGPQAARPVAVSSALAAELYCYLDLLAQIITLPPELMRLKSRLVPLLAFPGRSEWREKMWRAAERIVAHGPGTGGRPENAALVSLLQRAISERCMVRVTYRQGELELAPLGIVYLWEKRHWYLVALPQGGEEPREYRGDRLTDACLLPECYAPPPGFSLPEYLGRRWGISDDGKEYPVQVRFVNTEWNMVALERLQGEISRRWQYRPDCRLYSQGEEMFLEDCISGLNEFAAWVRSYGDAAQVCRPPELVERMCYTARRMLERYHEGEEDA